MPQVIMNACNPSLPHSGTDLIFQATTPAASIANAVRDALASIGAEVNETPLTPRRVLAAIRAARDRVSPANGRGQRK